MKGETKVGHFLNSHFYCFKCLLPINIINEKIYVFLWFWFIFLSVATFLNLVWSFGIMFLHRARKIIIRRKLKLW